MERKRKRKYQVPTGFAVSVAEFVMGGHNEKNFGSLRHDIWKKGIDCKIGECSFETQM